jgi:hypothetical protein
VSSQAVSTTYPPVKCASCGKLLGNCVYFGIIRCPRCGEDNLSDLEPVKNKIVNKVKTNN